MSGFFGKLKKGIRFAIKKTPEVIHFGKKVYHDVGKVAKGIENAYNNIPEPIKEIGEKALMAI